MGKVSGEKKAAGKRGQNGEKGRMDESGARGGALQTRVPSPATLRLPSLLHHLGSLHPCGPVPGSLQYLMTLVPGALEGRHSPHPAARPRRELPASLYPYAPARRCQILGLGSRVSRGGSQLGRGADSVVPAGVAFPSGCARAGRAVAGRKPRQV